MRDLNLKGPIVEIFFSYIGDRYPFISFCLVVLLITFIYFVLIPSSIHWREPGVTKRARTNPPTMDMKFLILPRNSLVFKPNLFNYYYTTGSGRIVFVYNCLDPSGMSIYGLVRLHNIIQIVSIEGVSYSGFIISPAVIGYFGGVEKLHLGFNSDWLKTTQGNGQTITSRGVPVIPDALDCAHISK